MLLTMRFETKLYNSSEQEPKGWEIKSSSQALIWEINTDSDQIDSTSRAIIEL